MIKINQVFHIVEDRATHQAYFIAQSYCYIFVTNVLLTNQISWYWHHFLNAQSFVPHLFMNHLNIIDTSCINLFKTFQEFYVAILIFIFITGTKHFYNYYSHCLSLFQTCVNTSHPTNWIWQDHCIKLTYMNYNI